MTSTCFPRYLGVAYFCLVRSSPPPMLSGSQLAGRLRNGIGIEPTARHGTDLGFIPVLITDACGSGDKEAAKRSIEGLKFAGDTLPTDTETICNVLQERSGIRSP